MRAVVIYESLTGNTRRAAQLIAEELQAAGVEAQACPIQRIDYAALAAADLVIVGSWTDGFIFLGQRPGRSGRLKAMPAMTGKRAVVFCTYAVDPGNTLDKLVTIVEDLGAEVLGGLAIKRTEIPEGARDFVQRVLDAAAV